MLSIEEIHDRVTYHSPSPAGVDRHARLSAAFEALMTVVNDTCPNGREQSLAFTNLEQAMFWANAAIARRSAP